MLCSVILTYLEELITVLYDVPIPSIILSSSSSSSSSSGSSSSRSSSSSSSSSSSRVTPAGGRAAAAGRPQTRAAAGARRGLHHRLLEELRTHTHIVMLLIMIRLVHIIISYIANNHINNSSSDNTKTSNKHIYVEELRRGVRLRVHRDERHRLPRELRRGGLGSSGMWCFEDVGLDSNSRLTLKN